MTKSQMMGTRIGLAILGSGLLLSAATAAAQTTPVVQETAGQALSRHLKSVGSNSQSLAALMGAGQAALAVGDGQAALTFFGRAEELAPRDGRIKMWIGSALVSLQQPQGALKFFDQALTLGASEAEVAGERGLAWDVSGDPRRAQRDYRLALQGRANPEVTRRLALSLAISGDRDAALRLLDEQLRVRDRDAERTRVLVLALTGDTAGAGRAVQASMPNGAGRAMTPFLERLPALNPAERALAVHFGVFPQSGRSAGPVPNVYASVDPVQAGAADPRQAGLGKTPDPRSGREAPAAASSGRVTWTAGRRALASQDAAPKSKPSAAKSSPPKTSATVIAASSRSLVAAPAAKPAGEERDLAPVPVVKPSERIEPGVARPATQLAGVTASVPSIPSERIELGVSRPVSQLAGVSASVPSAPSSPASDPADGNASSPIAETPVVLARVEPTVAGPGFSISSTPVATPVALPASAPAEAEASQVAAALESAPAVAAPEPAPAPTAAEPARSSRLADVVALVATLPDTAAPAPAAKPAPKPTTPAKVAARATPAAKPAAGTKLASAKAVTDKAAAAAAPGRGAKAAAKPEPAKKAAPAEPARVWVQVAGGAEKASLPREYARLKTKAPTLLAARSAWTTPLKATNRLLVGPFKTEKEAQEFVNQLSKSKLSGFAWTSEAGQKIEKLPAR